MVKAVTRHFCVTVIEKLFTFLIPNQFLID